MSITKKLVILAALAAAVAGAGYYAYNIKHAAKGSEYVTEKAKVGNITSSVSATGKLQPKVLVLVGTEVSGTIRNLYVDYNSVVKKGQVLLKLDQTLFRAQADQAGASLDNAEARLNELVVARDMNRSGVKTSIDQAKAALDKAKADFERSQKLFEKGAVASQDLDAAKETYLTDKSQYEQAMANTAKNDVTDAQIAEARAAAAQARANYQTAETNLGKSVIKAPIDGVIIDRNVEVGQTVAASFNTPTLFSIGDLSVMQVQISIDEADVGQAAVGQKAKFTVDAFPDRVFEGRVALIYYSPVTVQNVVTYTGIIEVDNPDKILRPGMTANVRIITSQKKGVLLIPSAALRVKMGGKTQTAKRGAMPEATHTVWVLRAGKPEAVQVVTGATDFTNTEVVSGLSEGDEVVVETPSKQGGNSGSAGGGPRPGGMMRM